MFSINYTHPTPLCSILAMTNAMSMLKFQGVASIQMHSTLKGNLHKELCCSSPLTPQ